MPKILLIADSDALWTKRAVKYLLLPAGYEIVIFPIWGHKGQFDDYYREHGVTVYRDPHRLPPYPPCAHVGPHCPQRPRSGEIRPL